MELKIYQKQVIADLSRYMTLLNETRHSAKAYQLLWEEKNVPIGFGGVPSWQDILPGVPTICMKVPTGGGKTFLACNAIKPVFDALPITKMKTVVWLVPSEAILTQTLDALKNPAHPYRQKINADFGSRVEVYTKQELLNGQNFNITTVSEQLSIMVLSYDSFRGRNEALKARQENSNLAPMAKALGRPDSPVEGADETALIQIINQLSPLVIVDESHHARSKLSKEMLQNFNPCFVLDLTATPAKESNIISYVDAIQLKRENMVKLPVIVYNRKSQQDVLADAIDLRNHLEQFALKEQETSNGYIRPIVLFQAQPKGKQDNTTFEKLREKLVDSGIPAEQIAIKTADINELKNKDILRPDCPIRYIITVNALKEGWDCPFAYILASLANRTSRIEVEQIVGRVLRQPHTRKHSQPALNMSYVLTSSNDFQSTLNNIVVGLNGAGFTEKDYRVGDEAALPEGLNVLESEPVAVQSESEDFLDFDPSSLKDEIQLRAMGSDAGTEQMSSVIAMLDNAGKEQEVFEAALEKSENSFQNLPQEIKEKMSCFKIYPQHMEEVAQLRLPQFFMKTEQSLFVEEGKVFLEKEHLAKEFSLAGQSSLIDFKRADDQMVSIDIEDKTSGVPKILKMNERDQRYIRQYLSSQSPDKKIQTCKDIIHRQLSKMDMVDDGELRQYVDRVIEQISNDKDTLSALEEAPQAFAHRIKKYIELLLENYAEQRFTHLLDTGEIVCQPFWTFPESITPLRHTNLYGRSLYQAEEEVNNLEREMVLSLTALENVSWWHRNMAKTGFRINGYINHYPDFIVRTKSKRIVLIETKGEHLDNEQNRKKLTLSRKWQDKAGDDYRYFMVFRNSSPDLDGAYSMNKFTEVLEKL